MLPDINVCETMSILIHIEFSSNKLFSVSVLYWVSSHITVDRTSGTDSSAPRRCARPGSSSCCASHAYWSSDCISRGGGTEWLGCGYGGNYVILRGLDHDALSTCRAVHCHRYKSVVPCLKRKLPLPLRRSLTKCTQKNCHPPKPITNQ